MTRAARHFITLALLLTVIACGTSLPKGQSTMPTKSGTGELRTDLEPLSKRFSLLAKAEKAEWMSGTLGDDTVPGPSTYWIDAVVTLPWATITEITANTREAGTPAVVDGLRGHLPGGPFRTGESLDDAFATEAWSVTAYLAENTNTIVLVAVGGQ